MKCTVATGCPEPGNTVVGCDGHGCNRSSSCNRCDCNVIGSRKGSDCHSNLTLLPQPPPPKLCELRGAAAPECNVTIALDFMRREAGAQIATSYFLYCDFASNASGGVSLNESTAGA